MEKSKALQDKIQAAVNSQNNRMPEIEAYDNFFKGNQYPGTPKRDEVTFNMIHTTIQAILRSIITGQPYIWVEPNSPEAVDKAPLVEKVINDYWRRLKVKYQLEFSVIDYCNQGMGISYVDWDFRLDSKGKLISDSPMVLNIPYKDFLMDPEANSQEIYEAGYMIRKFIKPTKEIKADTRYKKTKNLKGDGKLSVDLAASGDSIERNTLYQIWIPDDECSYVMRMGSDDIMREVPNKFGREYPFVLLQNYKMPGELWPYGETKILYEPQKILNKLFTMVITHAKRVSNRLFIANDLIKDSELRKLKDAEDGEVIKAEGNSRAGDVLTPVMDLQLSADVYRAFEMINQTIVQLSAVSEYRRSTMPSTERKATEAAYVEQASEMSAAAKAEDIAEHCEEISKKLFKLITHDTNITTQSVTYKDDEMGNWVTDQYSGASFPGVYSFKWESGVEAPINAQSRVQKLTSYVGSLAALMGNAPQLAASINWTELMNSMSDAFDIKNKDKILSADPAAVGQDMSGDVPGQGGAPGIANSIAARMTGR